MPEIKEHNGFLFLAVPEDATPRIRRNWVVYKYWNSELRKSTPRKSKLPIGKSYQIVGLSRDLTEAQKGEIVEKEELFINGKSEGIHYKDYRLSKYEEDDVCEWFSGKFNPAGNSFASLLKSLGLDGNVLIVKILK